MCRIGDIKKCGGGSCTISNHLKNLEQKKIISNFRAKKNANDVTVLLSISLALCYFALVFHSVDCCVACVPIQGFIRSSSMRFAFVFFMLFSNFRLFSFFCVLRCVFQTFCRPFILFSLSPSLFCCLFLSRTQSLCNLFFLSCSENSTWDFHLYVNSGIESTTNTQHKMHMKWDRFRCEKRLQRVWQWWYSRQHQLRPNRLWCW